MGENDHPTVSDFEEYIFERLPEGKVESVETHVLACESCLGNFEDLELHIAAMKLALGDLLAEETVSAGARQTRWFSVCFPRPSWVAAAALIALSLSLPQFIRQRSATPEISLHAYRGLETPVLPQRSRVRLALDAVDLPQGVVSVQVVDSFGHELWTDRSIIHNLVARVVLPDSGKKGFYFLRLYGTSGRYELALLREFVFRVQ
jgi:hypothetical protein